MAIANFKKPAAPVKKKSRYAGIKNSEDRAPMPEVGVHRFRVYAPLEECTNPGTLSESVKLHLESVVSEAHPEGQKLIALFMRTTVGLQELKSAVRFAAGYDDADEYDAFDPDGEFIDACAGTSNEYSAAELSIVGRLVDAQVSRGKDAVDKKTGLPTGDWYRKFKWAVVPEDEQDATAKPGAE